jgi:hypothetical protein
MSIRRACDAVDTERYALTGGAMVFEGSAMKEAEALDAPKDKAVAELKRIGAHRVFVRMAEAGQIIEIRCETPKCYCPKGRGWFDERTAASEDWMASADHYPKLKSEGGTLDPWNVRFSHVLCNREDHGRRSRINGMLKDGKSLKEIAETLNRKRIRTPHGGASGRPRLSAKRSSPSPPRWIHATPSSSTPRRARVPAALAARCHRLSTRAAPLPEHRWCSCRPAAACAYWRLNRRSAGWKTVALFYCARVSWSSTSWCPTSSSPTSHTE